MINRTMVPKLVDSTSNTANELRSPNATTTKTMKALLPKQRSFHQEQHPLLNRKQHHQQQQQQPSTNDDIYTPKFEVRVRGKYVTSTSCKPQQEQFEESYASTKICVEAMSPTSTTTASMSSSSTSSTSTIIVPNLHNSSSKSKKTGTINYRKTTSAPNSSSNPSTSSVIKTTTPQFRRRPSNYNIHPNNRFSKIVTLHRCIAFSVAANIVLVGYILLLPLSIYDDNVVFNHIHTNTTTTPSSLQTNQRPMNTSSISATKFDGSRNNQSSQQRGRRSYPELPPKKHIINSNNSSLFTSNLVNNVRGFLHRMIVPLFVSQQRYQRPLEKLSSPSAWMGMSDTDRRKIENYNTVIRSRRNPENFISTIEFCRESTVNIPFNSSDDSANTTFLNESSIFSLDNYCLFNRSNPISDNGSESKVRREQQLLDIKSKWREQPQILIIGGTDGSGTRAFVDLLRNELGTTIMYEDPDTFDIHASILFRRKGWPALANFVLNFTHSGNYEYNNLPQPMRNLIYTELRMFYAWYEKKGIAEFTRRSHFLDTKTIDAKARDGTGKLSAMVESGVINRIHPEKRPSDGRRLLGAHGVTNARGRGGKRPMWTIPTNLKSSAKRVLYGFKAPISMMLLPLMVELYGKIKFVHVIRDGRDVALSSNTSPVKKFYDTYYGMEVATKRRIDLKAAYAEQQRLIGEAAADGPIHRSLKDEENFITSVLAMDLWNDWNIQVRDYCLSHPDLVDYVVVRSEDLVSRSSSQRYAAITKLAHFVGTTNYSNGNICEYSQSTGTKDLGISASYDNIMKVPPTRQIGKKQDNYEQLQYYDHRTSNKYVQFQVQQQRRLQEQQVHNVTTPKNVTESLDNRARERLELAKASVGNNSGFDIPKSKTAVEDKKVTDKKDTKHIIPVEQRYGKWMTLLQNKTVLSNLLHVRGQPALRIFGYEPFQQIESDLYHSNANIACPHQ